MRLSYRISARLIISRLLILLGIGMIAYFYGTSAYTYLAQDQLRDRWQDLKIAEKGSSQSPESTEPVNAAPDMLDLFGRLRIPKLGLDVIVLEGTDRLTLMRGPGHITKTARPEEGRNTAISGHRTTFGAPFAKLDLLKQGDLIRLSTRSGDYIYQVTGRAVVRPTDTEVIGQQFLERLTLTTCDPPGSATRRLAVWAKRR